MKQPKEPNYTNPFSFQDLCENLRSGKNFSFSRFGDGEWNAIRGKEGKNRDAHPYDPKMNNQLKEIVKNPIPYTIGLQRMAYTHLDKDGQLVFQPYIDHVTSQNKHDWCNADILHHASIRGLFENDFIKALEGRSIILVAPDRLGKLMTKYPRTFGKMTHIVIPDVYCYRAFDSILSTLKKEVQQDDVIIYCASMMANILVDRMFSTLKESITQIDAGSVFEPYCDFQNRSYHSKIKSRIQ